MPTWSQAEARGFEGIFFPEHTHMPLVQKGIPYPGNDERLVHYRSIAEIVELSKACGLTTQLTCLSPARFGAQLHSVCQFFTSIVLIQRKPGCTC